MYMDWKNQYSENEYTYSVLGQVKREPWVPGSINHHEGVHTQGKINGIPIPWSFSKKDSPTTSLI